MQGEPIDVTLRYFTGAEKYFKRETAIEYYSLSKKAIA
jgi:hypothetical protein